MLLLKKSPHPHCLRALHRIVGDADRAVDNAGRDTEQITRSCRLSFVVGFSMIYPEESCWFRSGLFSAVVWTIHGRAS